MTRRRILCGAGVALAALTTVAGCATNLKSSNAPNAPITAIEFDEAPCDVYSPVTLAEVVQPALAAAGWPQVVENLKVQPDTRLSAQVQRCTYALTVAQPATYGDQSLTVSVYNEMSHGRALMDACEARGASGTAGSPSPSRPGTSPSGTAAGSPSPNASPLGDEACLDENGQWRFRVGDRYVSVAVNIPLRKLGDGEIVPPSSTGTFVAAQDVNTRAAVSRAVAEDLARRLR